MTLRVLVLTTETAHHSHFVIELQKKFDIAVVIESMIKGSEDLRRKAFDQRVQEFEEESWFSGKAPKIGEIAPSAEVEQIASSEGLQEVVEARADVAIVFGTRILPIEVLARLPQFRFNLHGGDPERYRGLDSHMWSLYHRDKAGLVTVLHKLETGVDSGDIISSASIDLKRVPSLEGLRLASTGLAISLTLETLMKLDNKEHIEGRVQSDASRYYSRLPGELLSRCSKMFISLKSECNE